MAHSTTKRAILIALKSGLEIAQFPFKAPLKHEHHVSGTQWFADLHGQVLAFELWPPTTEEDFWIAADGRGPGKLHRRPVEIDERFTNKSRAAFTPKEMGHVNFRVGWLSTQRDCEITSNVFEMNAHDRLREPPIAAQCEQRSAMLGTPYIYLAAGDAEHPSHLRG